MGICTHAHPLFNPSKLWLLSLQGRHPFSRPCYCYCIMAGNMHARTQPPAWRSAKAAPKCAIFNPRTLAISGPATTRCGYCSFSRLRWHAGCGRWFGHDDDVFPERHRRRSHHHHHRHVQECHMMFTVLVIKFK